MKRLHVIIAAICGFCIAAGILIVTLTASPLQIESCFFTAPRVVTLRVRNAANDEITYASFMLPEGDRNGFTMNQDVDRSMSLKPGEIQVLHVDADFGQVTEPTSVECDAVAVKFSSGRTWTKYIFGPWP